MLSKREGRHCNNGDGTLGKPAEGAETKIPQAASAIEGGAATKKHLEVDLKDKEVEAVATDLSIAVEGTRNQFAAATVAELLRL